MRFWMRWRCRGVFSGSDVSWRDCGGWNVLVASIRRALEGRSYTLGVSSTTARAAMPSSRPVNPKCSVVVALRLIC